MQIGLIDIDNNNFPNLVLMKLSAYHKAKGDTVQWYDREHCTDVFYKDIARLVNNRFIFAKCKTLEEYREYNSKLRKI